MRLKRIRWKDTANEGDKAAFSHMLYAKGGQEMKDSDGWLRVHWWAFWR